jgi:hypothetical protein
VEVYKVSRAKIPVVRILRAFEMRKGCAQEAIEADGCCPRECKCKSGAHCVDTYAFYAALRGRLGITI